MIFSGAIEKGWLGSRRRDGDGEALSRAPETAARRNFDKDLALFERQVRREGNLARPLEDRGR